MPIFWLISMASCSIVFLCQPNWSHSVAGGSIIIVFAWALSDTIKKKLDMNIIVGIYFSMQEGQETTGPWKVEPYPDLRIFFI